MKAEQEVRFRDCVYWYLDPLNPTDPQLGWVCRRPGQSTVSSLFLHLTLDGSKNLVFVT